MTLTEFIQLLDDHDWSFEYSDDPGAWSKGNIERRAIIAAARELGADAVALIRSMAPCESYAKAIEERL